MRERESGRGKVGTVGPRDGKGGVRVVDVMSTGSYVEPGEEGDDDADMVLRVERWRSSTLI